jgi:hypothetical protein
MILFDIAWAYPVFLKRPDVFFFDYRLPEDEDPLERDPPLDELPEELPEEPL